MRELRLRVLILFALALGVVAACQGPPPTMFVLVVTATPTPEGEVVTTPGAISGQTSTQPTATPNVATLPAATPTVNPFPTATINQIQVAEQRFENGRMFWLQPNNQIWVLAYADETDSSGKWLVYTDSFVDGEPVFDPEIVPPEGYYQPERGFGKLWRRNLDLRDALGWALESEFGHVTRYEYHPGGTVNAQNQYVAGPGYHLVQSLWGESYRFNEADLTWAKQQ